MNLVPRAPHDHRAPHIMPPHAVPGAFTVGSTLRHVLVMTATGAAGLVAVFMVEFLTLLYVSRLGDTNLTAAVGYASQITFLLVSVNIGLSIAIGALVSRALGSGDRERARHLAASGVTLMALVSGSVSFAAMPFTHAIVSMLGARGEALEVGATYLRIVLPGTIGLGLGMAFSSVLRGVGDARRAMYVTLGGAVVTACLDPIFIFVLHLGVDGAGIVVLLSRLSLLLVGFHGAVRVHDLVARPRLATIRADLMPLAVIAAPAVLTNIASPIANIYAMRVFSRYGDAVVAAFAIMDRVTPVTFGVLFALSGSVGPIMGQNFGARAYDRVRGVLDDCYKVAAIYVVVVGILLWVAAPLIVALFAATGETARLLKFFCELGGLLWFFLGGLFVANSAFNNLGWPVLSTVFNWGRATLGTIPFVTLGAAWHGPEGGYAGLVAGAALFGAMGVAGSYRLVGRLGGEVERGAAGD